jgi:hypothetical protein
MAESWPDWMISSANASELARYVNEGFTRAWVPADARGPWDGSEKGRIRAAVLYNALRSHWIDYAKVPWNPAHLVSKEAHQRIRTPGETIQGPATCLDLALFFASMAMSADMRPLIALRTGDSPHALVVLDLVQPLSDWAKQVQLPAPFTESSAEPGIWEAAEIPHALTALADSDGWAVVDVVRAALHGSERQSQPFAFASSLRTIGEFDQAGTAHRWTLVDVRQVQSFYTKHGEGSYVPPSGGAAAPIHGYLPALPGFTVYPSREGLFERLIRVIRDGAPQTIVVQAPQGFGKSMLARQLAATADFNCGWFLNSTDSKVLIDSLAQAERQERAQPGQRTADDANKRDLQENSALAAAALNRLRAAERPWVVVLDNCDEGPDHPALEELIPNPHRHGQFVIITTTNEGWLAHAEARRWRSVVLPNLEIDDLIRLDLFPEMAGVVAGRPLVAHALAALRDHGDVELPERSDLAGPDLIWELFRSWARASPEAARVARTLAWLPPEQMIIQEVAESAGLGSDAGDALIRLGFVMSTTTAGEPVIQLHRLFAEAVRSQTWRDEPVVAAATIEALLTNPKGRAFFINAPDSTALSRLEKGDVATAADHIPVAARRGLLWSGLGHVRERRGPVSASKPHFTKALDTLDRMLQPFEVAEALIGQARVVSQDARSTSQQLISARETAEEAQRVLATLESTDARQLGEQGNALAWLIAKQLAQQVGDPVKREIALTAVRDNLWKSYETRRKILHPNREYIPYSAPQEEDGMEIERAYFNLAGVGLELAKTHHVLAKRQDLGSAERKQLLAQTAANLDAVEQVYDRVRELRELRYGGQAHPHLAACIHGMALTAYYRAVLIDEIGSLTEASAFAAAAMAQRVTVAGGLLGPGSRAVLIDRDVAKSVNLTLKIALAATLVSPTDVSDGVGAALGAVREATVETLGRISHEDGGERL